MRILLISFATFFSFQLTAQKIIGAAMADDNGVTNNQNKAKYLIVEKDYGDTAFERLDYNFVGPMKTKATFLDSKLTILNGKYADYNSKGFLATSGEYKNNLKDGKWYVYDDTSHAVKKYTYHLDTLLSVIDLDSLSKEEKKIKEDTTGQIEAYYIGGVHKISKIIQAAFKAPERMIALKKDGTVNVRFVINTSGKPVDISILRSVEFSFDEEAIRVVLLLKDWVPANDKGRKVNAYRIQPITVNLN